MTKILLSLPDAEATRKLGVTLGRSLPAGTVILLEGDLGAGKTTLVQGIAEGLEIQDSIESPTFTLINEYLTGRIPLYHLDLYRLETEEVEALHLESYWDGLEMDLGIVAIEWAEKLPYKPDNYLQICLNYCDSGRQIELIGNWQLQDLPLYNPDSFHHP
ncbi:MAG: tRNA (adenosine(37)-N6)-threonylcarbamoyltransferase complex ATPase subunit type 1 TsaE [Microcoleus anatoxicus]|uniref:tRNA (adenosine(37)-N6)-threonylcarbamoyltransferase complex ATPase subunit type 1 TsaE n=1 Tax=Microcoleus anatoxicus TaxID=2705319 RepID=UPI00366F299B